MAEEGRHDACEEDMEFPSKVQSYRESVKRKRPTMKIARLNWASLKKKKNPNPQAEGGELLRSGAVAVHKQKFHFASWKV